MPSVSPPFSIFFSFLFFFPQAANSHMKQWDAVFKFRARVDLISTTQSQSCEWLDCLHTQAPSVQTCFFFLFFFLFDLKGSQPAAALEHFTGGGQERWAARQKSDSCYATAITATQQVSIDLFCGMESRSRNWFERGSAIISKLHAALLTYSTLTYGVFAERSKTTVSCWNEAN